MYEFIANCFTSCVISRVNSIQVPPRLKFIPGPSLSHSSLVQCTCFFKFVTANHRLSWLRMAKNWPFTAPMSQAVCSCWSSIRFHEHAAIVFVTSSQWQQPSAAFHRSSCRSNRSRLISEISGTEFVWSEKMTSCHLTTQCQGGGKCH